MENPEKVINCQNADICMYNLYTGVCVGGDRERASVRALSLIHISFVGTVAIFKQIVARQKIEEKSVNAPIGNIKIKKHISALARCV